MWLEQSNHKEETSGQRWLITTSPSFSHTDLYFWGKLHPQLCHALSECAHHGPVSACKDNNRGSRLDEKVMLIQC